MLPWLLRGAVLAGGRADYSATHTALLYAGRAVVGVGEATGAVNPVWALWFYCSLDSAHGATLMEACLTVPFTDHALLLWRSLLGHSMLHATEPAASPLPAAAVFRCFGEMAELPLLAVRPELQQRNGLGRLLLAAIEQLLLAAGAKVRAS